MKAPISLCLIVKNEINNIENCLRSIRDYVEEIVVVDTGSTDGTFEIVKKYADKYEVYLECNDENGNIKSFSQARQKSFELASFDWAMWIDGDDEVIGAENLFKLVQENSGTNPISILFPYEYSHDENGNPNCLHYRERLVCNKNDFKWNSPVHEVLVGPPNTYNMLSDEVKIIHRRQFSGKPTDPFRNFRILKKYVDEIGETEPRQLYYLGLEYGNIGDVDNAIKTLSRYVELSGWDDEKCLALLKIAQYYEGFGEFERSIEWASKAAHIKEDWGESYFHIARMYYALAQKYEGEEKNATRLWEKCCRFYSLGLSLPPTKTLLFVNPLERNVEIHRYFNYALNKLGRLQEALDSVNSALEFKSDDHSLLSNKKIYEIEISKKIINNELNKLKDLSKINEIQSEAILSLIDGNSLAVEVNDKEFLEAKIKNDIKESSYTTIEKSEKNIINVVEDFVNDTNKESIHMNWKPYHRPAEYPRNVKKEDFPVATITPHSQAWGIPESSVIDDLPLVMTDNQLQSMVVAIWKEYILHDEVLSAIKFLENAPYRVRHTPETEGLLKKTKFNIAWISDPKEYDKDNTPQDPNGNPLNCEMVPLPDPLNGQAGARMRWMTDRMPDKSKTILDMACIDGEMSNRWGLEGYKITGVDCCTNSIRIANEKAIEFNTGAKHVQCYFNQAPEVLKDEKFDYITCGDVYEHLIDPVNDLLEPAKKLVKEDGKMLMVTPHGAWMRGEFVSYAHPWLWANEGLPWNADKNRAHLIAPTVWSVLDHFKQAGWYVKNCTVVQQWFQDIAGQSNVCVEAFPKSPITNKVGKDIVFYIGNGLEDWTPHTVDLTGIGGSETAAINMAKNFANMGHRVRVYNSCGQWGEGVYDGVEYYQTEKFNDLQCDTLIVSRYAWAFDDKFKISSKKKILWVHDTVPYGLTEEICDKLDTIVALSKWHKENILSKFSFIKPSKVWVSSNGLDLSRFDKNVERNPFKAIYASSPDRGLPSLIQMWPKIKQKVPQAELHILYGFENWEKSASADQLNLIKELKSEIDKLKDLGVVYHGRVNQNLLAEHYLSAGAWLYSNWFSETSCIAAMEAQAAGLAIVTSPIAALNETVDTRGFRIPGDWLSAEYQEKFIEAAVYCLTKFPESNRQDLMKYAKENFSWTKVANSWNDEILSDNECSEFISYMEFLNK